jgi:galactose mutarotase-like enzyme
MPTVDQLRGYGEQIIISCGHWQACIDTHGAQVLGLFYKRKNLLYYNQSDIGHSGVPICLPNFGPLDQGVFKCSEGLYSIGQHGFVRDSSFELVFRAADKVSYQLCSSTVSRKMFPFDFCFTVTFTLGEQGLMCDYQFVNLCENKIPLAPGIHPYFAVSEGAKINLATKARYANDNKLNYAVIALEDRLNVLSIASDGTVQYEVSGSPDLHLIDHGLRDTQLTIGDDTAIVITADLDSFNRMTLWRRAEDSGFVCLEPAYVKNGLNDDPLMIASNSAWNSSLGIGHP